MTLAVLVLAGCESGPPSPPPPTQGAAWGPDVVPYVDELEISGGFVTPGSELEPADEITVLPGEEVSLVGVYVNRTETDQADMRLRFTAPDSLGIAATDVDVDEVDGADIIEVDEVGFAALLTRDGLPLGTIAAGRGARMTVAITAPERSECGSYSYTSWIGVVDATTGDRTNHEFSMTVEGEPC
jgi:hypothetical protein